jgi:hypothetical protein
MPEAADISVPSPQRHLLDRLPPVARKKLVRLIAEREAATAAARLHGDNRREVLDRRKRAEEALRRAMADEPFNSQEPTDRLRRARKELESARLAVADLNEIDDARSSNGEALIRLINGAFDFLGTVREGELVDVPPPVSTPRKNESAAAAVDRLRRRLRELDADRAEVEAAPLPSSIAKERAREQVAKLVEAGRPDVFELIERGAPVDFPTVRYQAASIAVADGGTSAVSVSLPDSVATLAWLFPSQMQAAIEAEIDRAADDEAALTPAQRRDRLAEIARDRAETEREEVSMVDRARSEGVAIAYRETDPIALLSVRRVDPPAPAPAPFVDAAPKSYTGAAGRL